ncbi:chitin synthase regulatory factor chr2 [Gigaspora margarita]|uniref:Chitin synthase regulatory factor chr2 n=1 Tax=Gigaspora margarita TaxID=4874 RepID=A0A8H4B0P4_GIGMA|nr:chitin synthase regulatory factor chr2 [Gigaspora margarita]
MKQYCFDSSHLMSIDGEIIMRNQLDEWVASCLESDNDSLQIINWSELYPIHDIFEESLCKDIKCILGINDTKNYVNEKVLKAGVIPIEELRDFYFVEFSSTLKSSNYRIFGKLMTKMEKQKMKWLSNSNLRILTDSMLAKDYVNLQITWILIGKPAEIGIFDRNTRNIAVICSENTSFTFQNDREDSIAQLKVPENLSTNSILITSIEYPKSNYEPNIITNTSESEVEYTSESEVEDASESEGEDNNENEVKDHLCEYSLDWCIILPENQVENENDNSCLPITMTHLKAIGQ